jgi:hypothetical protein
MGIEVSLRWLSARFAQRSVEDFFERSQDREFVVDAAVGVMPILATISSNAACVVLSVRSGLWCSTGICSRYKKFERQITQV